VAGRQKQVNTRLSVQELGTLKRLAKQEHRTLADTIRILIVRAGSALVSRSKNGRAGAP
jgi:hypothetical protein